jgi:hypothetical protein
MFRWRQVYICAADVGRHVFGEDNELVYVCERQL